MNIPPSAHPVAARNPLAEVLDRVLRNGDPLVEVLSPPGAGKTTLAIAVAATAAGYAGLRVAVVAPRAEQTYEIVSRLATHYPSLTLQLLQSSRRELPPALAGNPRIPRPVSAAGLLAPGPEVVVSTVDKLAFAMPDLAPNAFDLIICDEAAQVKYASFAPLFHLAPQVLLVGDPGQLPPLVKADTALFEAAACKVHWPVPKELRRRFPTVPSIALPATCRLLQDTVNVVQPSLYPDLPFVSAANPAGRRVAFGVASAGTAVDRALDLLAGGATIVGLLLPPSDLASIGVDDEVAELAAQVACRILDRVAAWHGVGPLRPADLGVVDPHVASEAAVRRHLRVRGISTDELMVGTPEIWQGLERPIMIAKHPLSGQRRPDPFSLEPGRLSVMLSRHLLGCMVVGRDGVGQLLGDYQHDSTVRPMGAADDTWAGWRAHSTIWSQLERMGRLIRT